MSRYFLLRYAMGRTDLEHQFLLDRCNEVDAEPDGYIDLWSRDHYKSTIITFAGTIQDILKTHGEDAVGEEATCGIFSHTRPIAKKFLRQIKIELQGNRKLQEWFPDVLFADPEHEAPRWSEDAGLVVKRKSNPKEATVEAWGLVDAQPTASHFNRLIYDDVVTWPDSVSSPEMIKKTTEALSLSYNLGTRRGVKRFIGTRYHHDDTYRTVLSRGTAKPRVHAATKDATFHGEPVFWDREFLQERIRDMGTYVAACQLMQNPQADRSQGFNREDLRFYKGVNTGAGMNRYIIVDPANDKKKKSDWTAMIVIGLGPDNNYYLLDLYRDKINLTERAGLLFRLHQKWTPLRVGYERYGKDSDIAHIQYEMSQRNYHFDIAELGGTQSKIDRIRRLLPIIEKHRLYLPATLHKTLFDGRTVDIIESFLVEEFDPFPVALHDDALDALSRIVDPAMSTVWPRLDPEIKTDRYTPKRRSGQRSFMSR